MKSLLQNPVLAVVVAFACAGCPTTSTSSSSSSGDVACTAGSATCLCRQDNSCDVGLTCSVGRCIPGSGADGGQRDAGPTDGGGVSDGGGVMVPVSVVASAAGARSCEVVLTDSAKAITGLSFSGDVEGRFLRRGERLAVAFSGRTNAQLPAAGVNLLLQSAGTSLTGMTLSNNRCFDAQGAVLSGATVTLVDQR